MIEKGGQDRKDGHRMPEEVPNDLVVFRLLNFFDL